MNIDFGDFYITGRYDTIFIRGDRMVTTDGISLCGNTDRVEVTTHESITGALLIRTWSKHLDAGIVRWFEIEANKDGGLAIHPHEEPGICEHEYIGKRRW